MSSRLKKLETLRCAPVNDNEDLLAKAATPDDVKAIFGDIEYYLIDEILSSRPTVEDLEQVYAWLVNNGEMVSGDRNSNLRGFAAVLDYVMNGDDGAPDIARALSANAI